jgi:hypothetical protein
LRQFKEFFFLDWLPRPSTPVLKGVLRHDAFDAADLEQFLVPEHLRPRFRQIRVSARYDGLMIVCIVVEQIWADETGEERRVGFTRGYIREVAARVSFAAKRKFGHRHLYMGGDPLVAAPGDIGRKPIKTSPKYVNLPLHHRPILLERLDRSRFHQHASACLEFAENSGADGDALTLARFEEWQARLRDDIKTGCISGDVMQVLMESDELLGIARHRAVSEPEGSVHEEPAMLLLKHHVDCQRDHAVKFLYEASRDGGTSQYIKDRYTREKWKVIVLYLFLVFVLSVIFAIAVNSERVVNKSQFFVDTVWVPVFVTFVISFFYHHWIDFRMKVRTKTRILDELDKARGYLISMSSYVEYLGVFYKSLSLRKSQMILDGGNASYAARILDPLKDINERELRMLTVKYARQVAFISIIFAGIQVISGAVFKYIPFWELLK